MMIAAAEEHRQTKLKVERLEEEIRALKDRPITAEQET